MPYTKKDFKVGDIVLIRTWDDMVAEFGLTDSGTIDCELGFTYLMSNLCERKAEIKRVTGKYITLNFIDTPAQVDTNWAFSTEMVEPLSETIIIHRDKNQTIAKLKQGKSTIKTAVAKCSPDDSYDFQTGAKLAVERLFEPDQPEFSERQKALLDCAKLLGFSEIGYGRKGFCVCCKSDTRPADISVFSRFLKSELPNIKPSHGMIKIDEVG